MHFNIHKSKTQPGKNQLRRFNARLDIVSTVLAGFDLAGAQDIIASEMSNAYSDAKERLLIEDAELAQAIRDVKDLQRDEGKYKR